MTAVVKIRFIENTDQSEWVRMRTLLWPDCPVDRHKLETDIILASQGFVLFAELAASILVGFAEVSIRSDHVEGTKDSPVPYLEGWYVEPSHRGQGIGKALIKTVEDIAVENGFKELESDTEVENKSSIDIHKKMGFREAG